MPKCTSYYYECLGGAEDSAKKLANAGYGNIEQAIREFAEELKADLNNAYVNATTPFQAGKNAGLDNALILIDELFKELYGEGRCR